MSHLALRPARVLVVDPDARRRARLAAQLTAAGFSIDQKASGFAALTSIERALPDLVVTRWDAGEMSAVELCSAIRTDASLAQLKAVLVLDPSERLDRGALNGSFDLVVEGAKTLPHQLHDLIAADDEAVCEEGRGDPPLAFTGTGSFTDVTDIIQLVGARLKSGILSIGWDREQAQVLFDHGIVRHARFRSREGRRAVLLLFTTLRTRGGASFAFEPVPAAKGLGEAPYSICQPAHQLLIDIAVALDERVEEVAL